jgi:DNA mismatch repair protein MutL
MMTGGTNGDAARRPIRALERRTIERIAAGETIERPASVVKELVENAIDAGAGEITVELRGGGTRSIRVSDDGAGIPADELPLAFARHATSKLRDADDLWHLDSLGFRGEALASIGAMGETLLITATDDSGEGAGVLVSDGRIVESFSRARARGTTVTVRALFADIPARQKFLRPARTESAQINALVRRYALARPDLRFRLVLDGHLSFQSDGDGDLGAALAAVYGPQVARAMTPLPDIDIEGAGEARVWGVLGGPQLHRPSRKQLSFFVNGRWATPRNLADALEAAYRPFFPRGRHPVGAIFIDLPPEGVDVNVHPAKAEVQLLHERAIAEGLSGAVRTTLARHQVAKGNAGFQLATLRGLPTADALLAEERAPWDAAPAGVEPALADLPPISGPNLPPLRFMGQLREALLLAEGPDGLYLIDQHRAHERIIYERLLAGQSADGSRQSAEGTLAAETQRHRDESEGEDGAGSGGLVTEPIEPIIIELGPLQAALLDDRLPELAEVGIVCESFGGRSFLIRALPAIGEHEDLRDALPWLVEDDEGWRERLMVNLSCRAALRKGRPLSVAQARGLLTGLAACDTPAICPHGSPIILHLDEALLTKQFGW